MLCVERGEGRMEGDSGIEEGWNYEFHFTNVTINNYLPTPTLCHWPNYAIEPLVHAQGMDNYFTQLVNCGLNHKNKCLVMQTTAEFGENTHF